MVENRITDGKRIAQLLASELTGLSEGVLAAIDLADVDRDAEPTQAGTLAYRITYEGEPIADVFLFPSSVVVRLLDERQWPEDAPLRENGEQLRIEYGAAVKGAVDAIRLLVE